MLMWSELNRRCFDRSDPKFNRFVNTNQCWPVSQLCRNEGLLPGGPRDNRPMKPSHDIPKIVNCSTTRTSMDWRNRYVDQALPVKRYNCFMKLWRTRKIRELCPTLLVSLWCVASGYLRPELAKRANSLFPDNIMLEAGRGEEIFPDYCIPQIEETYARNHFNRVSSTMRRHRIVLSMYIAPFVLVVTLVGNLLTIYGFLAQHRKGVTPYKHQISLVINDILSIFGGVSVMLWTFYRVYDLFPAKDQYWASGFKNILWHSGTYSGTFVNIFLDFREHIPGGIMFFFVGLYPMIAFGFPSAQQTLVIGTVLDRLDALLHPLEYQHRNQSRRAKMFNAVSYVVGFSAAFVGTTLRIRYFPELSQLTVAGRQVNTSMLQEYRMSFCYHSVLDRLMAHNRAFYSNYSYLGESGVHVSHWSRRIIFQPSTVHPLRPLAYILFNSVVSMLLLSLTVMLILLYRKTMRSNSVSSLHSARAQQRVPNNDSKSGVGQQSMNPGTSTTASRPSSNSDSKFESSGGRYHSSNGESSKAPPSKSGTKVQPMVSHKPKKGQSPARRREPTSVRVVTIVTLIEACQCLLLNVSISIVTYCEYVAVPETFFGWTCKTGDFMSRLQGGMAIAGNFILFIVLSREFRQTLRSKLSCLSA